MKIRLVFDEKDIRKYYSKGSWIYFGFWCENDGKIYPEENWMDFGGEMLISWIGTICQLKPGGETLELSFMDGPFSLFATLSSDGKVVSITPSDKEFVWQVSLIDLMHEVTWAAERVCAEFRRLKIEPNEVHGLQMALVHR